MSEAPVYGSREHDEHTRIWLLMSRATPQARGFCDNIGTRRRVFTFAFTTPDLAKCFLAHGRAIAELADCDLLLQMTCAEFFAWVEQGKAEGELVIDPDPELLDHHLFAFSRNLNN